MFYTVREVAELLKVSQATIRRLIKAGKLEAYRVGKQLRIPAEAVRGILENPKDYRPKIYGEQRASRD